MDLAWQEHAACRGMNPDLFHPEPGEHRSDRQETLDADRVCATCPVKYACLDYGMRWADGIYGEWAAVYRVRVRRTQRQCPWCGMWLAAYSHKRMFCGDACVTAAEQSAGEQRVELETRLDVLLADAVEWNTSRRRRDPDRPFEQLAMSV